MKLLQSIAALLAVLMLPAAPVTETVQETALETAQEIVQPQQSEEWSLLLVNRWNPVPEGYTFTQKQLSNGKYVDARIYDDLDRMLSDCREAGLNPLVTSAYRSESYQTQLYKNKIARLKAAGYSAEAAEQEAMRWVAVPGTSEHHTGMALDIVAASNPVLTEVQEDTAEQKWLMEHCWEYGFILRYPEDKCDITGIGYEPWHYRYVGKEAALAMRDSGLCMEEYINLLQMAETATETAAETGTETTQEAAPAAS